MIFFKFEILRFGSIGKLIPSFPILSALDELEGNSKLIRDKAIILLGFSGGFRRSELVNIDYDDIEFVNEDIKIFVKGSKTDQSGEGMTKGIPYFLIQITVL